MKFSYSLIKKFIPALKDKQGFVCKFNLHAFETEDAGGDALEIKLPANRYADASSHWGIAKEAAAIWNTKLKIPLKKGVNTPSYGKLAVKIEDPKLCGRYSARLFEVGTRTATPRWMEEVLRTCGLRPINLIVDVMNYVMLEVGQPLHAFDADKISGEKEKKIIVRRAKRDEIIVTLDDHRYMLDKDTLAITDKDRVLAIAGVKGGKYAEVSRDTKYIAVEAAYFDPVNIFKTSKKLKLATDASVRFAHGLHPELVLIALERVGMLLGELADAKLVDSVDVYPKKEGQEIIGLRVARLNSILGTSLSASNISAYLKRLGFAVRPQSKEMLLVETPPLRRDVAMEEDIIEEVARIYDLSNIKSQAPISALKPTEYQDDVRIKDSVRIILTGLGFNEVYNHSFFGEKEAATRKGELIELENPISEERRYLRHSLVPGLRKNAEDNLRFFDEVRLFEIGKIFGSMKGRLNEKWQLSLAIAEKGGHQFLELKGVVDELLKRIGLTDFTFKPVADSVVIESDHSVLGSIASAPAGKRYYASIAELDLGELIKITEGEREYLPPPKYPGITRDISLFVNRNVRVGELLEAINTTPTKYVEDVDMIDFYEDPNLSEERKSVTFRFVLQAEDHTLTDEEAGDEMQKIIAVLREKFDIEIR